MIQSLFIRLCVELTDILQKGIVILNNMLYVKISNGGLGVNVSVTAGHQAVVFRSISPSPCF